jgi:inorganic pyrophosphatase
MRRPSFLLLVLAFTRCARPEAAAPSVEEPQYAVLPARASDALLEALAEARPQGHNTWRDTEPFNADGTLNGYIEIPRGERTKWEFDIGMNRREVDRVLPESMPGYPVNYGFVPQTQSYDGDPFDVLVLGPPLEGGSLVRGVIVGIMNMADEKGPDMKVVTSVVGSHGEPLHALSPAEQTRIGAWFASYKAHEAAQGKWSRVLGWGSAAEGRRRVDVTHGFFAAGLARRDAE